ncbi:EamA family transporter [Saccharothrix violaceirubra]|uniref:DME family drug/metabolite transporter n=1 Tax=Saccharothrix violaceirubra TaxID=413306 RepID=A0A7W7T1V3_9PSEU|nr:EamA family transporter [Saccharothrix violaceirubra]MBB4965023.1 DME family drug/metabolite transporter [Saccharothrix violaceirubra]
MSAFAPTTAPRVAIGAAALAVGGVLLFLTSPGTREVLRDADRRLLAVGAVTVAGYASAFYPAVARTGVAVSTTIALATAPILLGARARPVVTAVAVVGCATLVLGAGGARLDLLGVVLALVAGLSYAVYPVATGKLIAQGFPARAVVGTMFGGAALVVWPIPVVLGLSWLTTPGGLAVVAHLAIVTTFTAYLLFALGLRHTSAAAATTLTLAEPAVAALLGVVVLDEHLPPISWLGMAVLTAALFALTRESSTRTP